MTRTTLILAEPKQSAVGRPRRASRPRRADEITDRMLELIERRVLKAGDVLPSESEIAQQFDVSKPVVREALRRLAEQGLVQIKQGKPTKILDLTAKPLSDFFRNTLRSTDEGLYEVIELRRAVETDIAALAASRAESDDLAALSQSLERLASVADEIDEWVQADIAFHLALAASAKNRLMQQMVEAMQATMRFTIREMRLRSDRYDPAATVERHGVIVECIRNRKPEEAARAMRFHFSASEPQLSFVLKRGGN